MPYGVLDKAMKSRLQTSSGFRGIDYDHFDQPTNLTVRTWQRNRTQVESLLSVQETPQLVLLESAAEVERSATAHVTDAGSQREPPNQAIPVVSGIDTTSLLTEEHSLSTVVHAVGSPFELSSELVGKVSARMTNDKRQLVVELTPRGRQQLASKLAGADSTGGLGLVIGSLVEGIATKESISHQQIVFQLSPASDLTSDGIAAGIRGPHLPTQLELLD
jgi:hypothetical protein